MAGSEQIGLRGADPDLFEGAVWVLTPTAATDLASFDRLKGVVMSLGADVLVLSAADHDRLVAVVSHVPHLVAATLMNAASTGAEQDGALLRLAAGGFRDMTRVAAGHPGIWPDICAENAGGHRRRARHADRRPAAPCATRWPATTAPRCSSTLRVGQRGPAQPARPHRPARPPGRAAHPGGRRARRRGRAHLAGRRRRHQHLRHRDRPLGRGPPRRRSSSWSRTPTPARWPPPSRPAATAAGWSRCREHARGTGRAGRRGRRALPGHRAHAGGEVDLAPLRAARPRWPRAPRSCTASPTGPTWRPRWPRSRPWASPSNAGPTVRVVLHGGRSLLHAPEHPLDCGNSGTSMRLLSRPGGRPALGHRAGRRRVALGPAHGPGGRTARR